MGEAAYDRPYNLPMRNVQCQAVFLLPAKNCNSAKKGMRRVPIPANLSLFQGDSRKGCLSGMYEKSQTLRVEKNLTGAEAPRERGKICTRIILDQIR